MKNTILLLNGLWLLGLVACQPKSSSLSECPIVNVRSALQEETPISMKEDVVSIQYIPLETKDDFICQGLVLAIGKDIILARNRIRDGDIFIYDRKTGKGLKKIKLSICQDLK